MLSDVTKWVQLFFAVGVLVLFGAFAFVLFRPGPQASAGVEFSTPTNWVEHGLESQVVQVNAVTGEVVGRVSVGESAERLEAVAHGSGAVVLNHESGVLSVIDGQQLSLGAQFDLDLTTSGEERDLAVFGSSDREHDVVVTDNDQVIVIDVVSGELTAIPLDEPLADAARDQLGRFLALSGDGNALLSFQNGQLATLNQLPDQIGADRHLVSAGGEVHLVDPSRLWAAPILDSGELDVALCLTSAANGAQFGQSSSIGGPQIIGLNQALATLTISGDDGCRDIALDIQAEAVSLPVVSDGFAYVSNYDDARIHVVDLETEQEIARLPFGSQGEPFDLRVQGSTVWANEPNGPSAAVVDGGSITPVLKLEAVVAGIAVTNAQTDDGDEQDDAAGFRILGDSGSEVLARAEVDDAVTASGASGSDEAGDAPESAISEESPVPDAVGIAADAIAPLQRTLEEIQDTSANSSGSELIANFSLSSTTVAVGEVVRFTDFSSGDPVSWTWDFGDGTGAQQPNIDKAWQQDGVFVVELTVTNEVGDRASQSTEVTVVPASVVLAPTADFSFDRNTVEVDEPVRFTSRTTGTATSLQWDFGDGSGDIGEVVEHSYGSPGEYTVTLTAANDVGSTAVSSVITVLAAVQPPEAVIAPIDDQVTDGQFVTFRSVSRNDPTTLRWNFGDGSTGIGDVVRHQFSDPGTYRVRLEVANSAGADTTFVDVTVVSRQLPPVAQLTQSDTQVLVGERVVFGDLSQNEPTAWVWDFGDGTGGRGQRIEKSWNAPGSYVVTLRASNDAGSDVAQATVRVDEPVSAPTASFSVPASVVSTGSVVAFSDTSSNLPRSWAWDFGDGSRSSSESPSHVFEEPGTYTVTLTVTNEGGSSTATQDVIVRTTPSANFRFVVTGRTVDFTDTSWDDPQNWRWDFGDGNTTTQRSPEHTYEQAGTYTVTLVVSNEVGTSEPRRIEVSIAEPPVAVATCAVVGRTLECDGSQSRNAASFRWASDGAEVNTSPRGEMTVFAYDSAGRKDVSLTVTSPTGEIDTVELRSPRVARGLQPRVLDVDVSQSGDLITLTASFDRDPVTWNWELDGARLVQGGDGPTAVFRVPSDGAFSGQVRVENAFGSDTDSLDVDVARFEPRASFSWEIVGPGLVEFTNTSDVQDDFSVRWRTPDAIDVPARNRSGTTAQFPAEGGTFTVSLEVTDVFGTDLFEEDIVVPPVRPAGPVASYTWEITEPGVVAFTNTSQAEADATVVWRTLGDDENVLVRNRQRYVVELPVGRFTVMITVSDDNGSDVFEQVITVPDPDDE